MKMIFLVPFLILASSNARADKLVDASVNCLVVGAGATISLGATYALATKKKPSAAFMQDAYLAGCGTGLVGTALSADTPPEHDLESNESSDGVGSDTND